MPVHRSLTSFAYYTGLPIRVSVVCTLPTDSVELTFPSPRSILELQTLLVELISNFEFSLNERSEKVRRFPCAVMVPLVSGEEDKGAQMPLKVSLAPVN
jgi:hypothetical protein